MKILPLILGLGIGVVGTTGFYIYSFDKADYEWVAPQSLRENLNSSTAIVLEKTSLLADEIEKVTGLDSLGLQAAHAENRDDHGDEKDHDHGKEGHKDDDHGDEKDHDHGKEGHKDDDHGDEKDHGHGKEGHKDDDHGDEKDHGHGKEGHKDDDHGDEKDHDHGKEGHKDDDHGDEKDHDHGKEGHKDDDHGDEKNHGHGKEGHKDDDHGDEKDHGHGKEGHKDDDHGDEKDHGHGKEGHKDDDHGDEKDRGHGKESHDDHGGEELVRLTKNQQEEFGVELGVAKALQLAETVNLPGEIKYNEDRLSHIVPRVKGIVVKVFAKQGDYVHEGDVLAVLESRELATIKSQYLAAVGRLEIAQTTYDREARLRKEKISTEQTYLEAKSAFAEAKIVLRTISQQLYALGFNSDSLNNIQQEEGAALTKYQIVSPFAGRVIARHVTLGETISDSNQAFTVADMSELWVDFQVFPKDLEKIREGQAVQIFDENDNILTESHISFIAAQIQEETRTGTARVQVPRTNNSMRPGLFVTAVVEVGRGGKVLTIPKTAPQIMNGKTVVFIQEGDAFEAREIALGRTQGKFVEVLSGIDLNTEIATEGGFVLKAQLSKAQFGDGHNH